MGLGFYGKLIRVDLSSKRVTVESLNEESFRKYLSGSGLAAKILYEEFDNTLEPLHPEVPLAIVAGLLTGIPVPCACKLSICARSPQTGIWDEVTVGRYFGAELKFAGYDGLIITGKSKNPIYIWIIQDKVRIKSAEHLWGGYLYYYRKVVERDSSQGQSCLHRTGWRESLWDCLSDD